MIKAKAFTLIEVLVAVFILTLAVGGALTVIQQTVALTSSSSFRLTASYLAQEGIEIVGNIRDSNWLKQRSVPGTAWDEGLPTGDWEADYSTLSLGPGQEFLGTGTYLRYGSGFFNYSSGSQTNFRRKIAITPSGPDTLEILVEVFWEEKGRTHYISVQENLYQWK